MAPALDISGSAFAMVSSCVGLRRDKDELPQQVVEGWLKCSEGEPFEMLKVSWDMERNLPTEQDLVTVENFSEAMLTKRSSLEEVYSFFDARSGCFTVFGLRNMIAVLGLSEELEPAENIFRSLTCTLHIGDGVITKDKFLALPAFIQRERELNQFLQANDAKPDLETSGSGSRLQSLVSLAQKCDSVSTAHDILKYIQILLESEPRSTCHHLLLATPPMLTSIVHMAVKLEAVTSTAGQDPIQRVWSLCRAVVQQAQELGRPKTSCAPPLKNIALAQGSAMAAVQLVRRQSSSLLQDLASKDRPTSSLIRPMLPSKLQRRRTVDDTPSRSGEEQTRPATPICRRPSLLPPSISPSLSSPSLTEKVVPRGSKGIARSTSASQSVAKVGLLRRSTIDVPSHGRKVHMVPNDWQMECCARLWSAMPPKSLTFCLGVCSEQTGRSEFPDLTRAAWSLLDFARAAEWSIGGSMGTTRLMAQLQVLSQACQLEADELDVLQLAQTCQKVGILCTDKRQAKVAMLYGASFLVERLRRQVQESQDKAADKLQQEGQAVMEMLRPHLAELFAATPSSKLIGG